MVCKARSMFINLYVFRKRKVLDNSLQCIPTEATCLWRHCVLNEYWFHLVCCVFECRQWLKNDILRIDFQLWKKENFTRTQMRLQNTKINCFVQKGPYNKSRCTKVCLSHFLGPLIRLRATWKQLRLLSPWVCSITWTEFSLRLTTLFEIFVLCSQGTL